MCTPMKNKNIYVKWTTMKTLRYWIWAIRKGMGKNALENNTQCSLMSSLNETDCMITQWRNQRSKANEVIITHTQSLPLNSRGEPAVATLFDTHVRLFDSMWAHTANVFVVSVVFSLHVDRLIFTWMISLFGRVSTQCVTTIDDVTLYSCLDILCLCLTRLTFFSWSTSIPAPPQHRCERRIKEKLKKNCLRCWLRSSTTKEMNICVRVCCIDACRRFLLIVRRKIIHNFTYWCKMHFGRVNMNAFVELIWYFEHCSGQ